VPCVRLCAERSALGRTVSLCTLNDSIILLAVLSCKVDPSFTFPVCPCVPNHHAEYSTIASGLSCGAGAGVLYILSGRGDRGTRFVSGRANAVAPVYDHKPGRNIWSPKRVL
jgi:hypothetical protein